MMTCVSYSTGQESKGLSRKSYRGRWIPGDPLTGSGGGCASPMFLQVQKRHPGKTQKSRGRGIKCFTARTVSKDDQGM